MSGARFSNVPRLFGRISGDIILFVSLKRRRLEARNFAVILIFIPFTTYEKTSFTEWAGHSFTNGRNVFWTFEKRAPGEAGARSLESLTTTDKRNKMTLPTHGLLKVDFAVAAKVCRRWFCFCFTMLCQVLVTVLMCLLDWLMVIPVSKLLSKTNEDDNISLLNRIFQVIFQTTETLVLREGIF